jgi:cell division transport system permease protein
MRAASCCMKVDCMSTTRARTQEGEGRAQDEPWPTAAQSPARYATPIVPRATISGRSLVGVVAIMTFLASLTAGAVMLVRSAAVEWQADVAREVTIQIRAPDARDLESEVARTVTVARAFPGVAEVRPYSKDETMRLLEPWLGSGLQFEDLPIPRIIVVRIAVGAAPDLAQLRAVLAEQVPGAVLDDHRGFVARMRAMAGAAVVGGLVVLSLVLLATVLSVTFATRAAMATNHPVIEVLHLIGAKDNFIAAHFQRHFLQLGLKGGLIGGGVAIALFAFADLAGSWFIGTAGGDQFAAMFGTFSIGALGYFAILVQIGLVAGVTAAASRRTVKRTIETIQ